MGAKLSSYFVDCRQATSAAFWVLLLDARTLTPLSPSAPADIRILRRHHSDFQDEDDHRRRDCCS